MQFPENPDKDFYSERSISDKEIGYPVHVYFIELSKMYMRMIRWHWHDEVEIMIINHGEVYFLTDDTKIVLKAGQGVLINQNTMHSIKPVDPDANCSLYSTVFHPSFLFSYGNTVMSGKYLTPVLSSPVFRYMILDESEPVAEKVLNLINSVIAVNMTKKYGFELVTKSYLCQFWVLLLENVIPQNVKKSKVASLSQDEIRVKDAIRYIEEHYADHIALEDLADAISISKSECCRCFRRTLQLTPIEYLMKYRIFKAANMIQSDDPAARSISDLAFAVGFNNASYFNKVFKQFLKCTPSEYRRNLKKDPTSSPFRMTSI